MKTTQGEGESMKTKLLERSLEYIKDITFYTFPCVNKKTAYKIFVSLV